MSSRPFFSINIPARNVGKLVLESLESVAKQTFLDWEVLVADDGSSDQTRRICRSQQLIPQDRFTLLEYDHAGQYSTRRKLFAASKGKVIVSLDSDDTLLDDGALSTLHELFLHEDCDLVLFNATRSLRTREHFVNYGALDIIDGCSVRIESALRSLYCSYDLNNVCTKAYRREVGSFSYGDRMIRNTEDRLQSIELFRNVNTCCICNEPLYYYRPNEASVTSRPYQFSYFEDFVFVETQAELLLGPLVNEREGRSEFLCTMVARNLQRLHDSCDEPLERQYCYRIARELCMRSGLFPTRSAPIRRDCRIIYDTLMEGQYRLLDSLLGLKHRAKRIFHRMD